MKQYPSLKSASAQNDFQIELIYDNGEKRIYDFSSNLMHPFYQELNNTALFSQMYVENGELLWRTGQDFCPNTLYENSTLITA